MRCTNCNKGIRQHKRSLEKYGYCLSCLPKEHRCKAVTGKGTDCLLPAIAEGMCSVHLISKRTRKKGTAIGFVYVFSLGYDNLYKIGQARNWKERLHSLQAGNPRIDKMYAYQVRAAKTVERECHMMMREHHVGREVFRLDDIDLHKLKSYLQHQRL